MSHDEQESFDSRFSHEVLSPDRFYRRQETGGAVLESPTARMGQARRQATQGRGQEESKERWQVMAVYKQKKSNKWWYKFTWNGELIRESTKQTNKRVAEQMEAAHKTALAKGEVGIRERKPIPTLRQFAEGDFLPYVRSTFAAKVKTKEYYEYGVKSLLKDAKLAGERAGGLTSEKGAGCGRAT